MFLKEIKIWNFRKFGELQDGKPGLDLQFHKNFNLLIGENDSGKSAIIDAIHLTLGTVSSESMKITEEDFYVDTSGISSNEIKIECIFSELSQQEAGIFLEWLSFDEEDNYELIVRLTAKKIESKITGDRIEKVVKAGPVDADNRLEGLVQELLKATYLKPLRDAKNELKPGFRSRLAQILKSYSAFKVTTEENHQLEEIVKDTNKKIEEFFEKPIDEKTIIGEVSKYLEEFFHTPKEGQSTYKPKFEVTPAKLNDILRKLSLELDDKVSGLGSLNLLFIAAEMLLLNDDDTLGANLTLIEEIEAHLHPQAQLRLIKYLQKNLEASNSETVNNGQFILSTHSTTLAASTSLEHIILIHDNKAYPMGSDYTNLAEEDYKFLERFLDATKANLFFAKGVIFVEGDAENLLLPTLAELVDRPLHKYGVSIVNIGNTAFKRYAKIFSRSKGWLAKGNSPLKLPVSVVTDVDVRPFEFYKDKKMENTTLLVIQDEDKLKEIISLSIEPNSIEIKELQELIGQIFNSFTDFTTKMDQYALEFDKDKKDEIIKVLSTSINKELITTLKKNKKKQIKLEFESFKPNLEIFVAPNWTLEYELSLSSLSKDLAEVIHSIRYKNPYTNTNKKKLEIIIENLAKSDQLEKVAYEIYKPLNDKIVSKAIVAQALAKKIENSTLELKNALSKDPYLDYLIKAIYHVTEPMKGDKRIGEVVRKPIVREKSNS
ncbi:ATP-dependent nuclease [Priestia megaterium]|uniref:ATP-dependent nuclease n=1 Tax=Priestia megaterium TaxID=1404 RepID=UPI00207AAEF2|nr:AAA family ATPase [Priestia megaterium]USL27998.1 AAA family ATPase [Priestia megaterium]